MTAFFYGQDDRYVAGAWTRRSDDVQGWMSILEHSSSLRQLYTLYDGR
jgi:hypothetical protein